MYFQQQLKTSLMERHYSRVNSFVTSKTMMMMMMMNSDGEMNSADLIASWRD